MIQPKFSNVDPNLLAPNPWNTNQLSPDAEDKIDVSLQRNGLFKPILVRELEDGALQIIGGEHRWESAKRLNYETIPICNLGPITELQAKEIGIIDNARYGADDTLPFAELLKEIGAAAELTTFLPFGDQDLALLFSSADIALDDLGIDEAFEKDQDEPEPPAAKAAKTHTVMRFKIALLDAEKITALIARTQRAQGLTSSDELTNAGDALVHLLVDQFATPVSATTSDYALEDIDAVLEGIDK